MNRIFYEYLSQFIFVLMDDILIYSTPMEEYEILNYQDSESLETCP